GAEDLEEIVEPVAAELLLAARGNAVALRARESAGVAPGDGREVDPAVEVGPGDSPQLQPVAELLAPGTGERTMMDRGPDAGRLADQENPGEGGVGLGVEGDRHRFGLV